jgi:hypothetical protein
MADCEWPFSEAFRPNNQVDINATLWWCQVKGFEVEPIYL